MSIYEYDEEKHMRQTREEGFEDGFGEGFEKGKQSEKQRLLKLISCMSTAGETERIPELVTDNAFLEEMYKKYNL